MKTQFNVMISCAVVGTILFSLIPSVFSDKSILCYQCNSKKDPGCAELPPLAPNSTTARYLNPCDAGVEGEPPFCRKSIIKVLAANNGLGEERVVRSCGWYKHKNECYQFDDDDHHELVCQCFTDACNGARSLRAEAPPLLLAVVLTLCSSIVALCASR